MRADSQHRITKRLTLAWGLMIGCLLAGCDGQEAPSDPAASAKPIAAGGPPAASQAALPVKPIAGARLDQSFKEATVHEPPEGQWLLEVTHTMKSVGKLYETVVRDWEKTRFHTPDGKKIAYTATITTDRGNVVVELWPEIAPNHVRSFIGLVRAGYFDGLAFDRAIKWEEGDGQFFECLEAGCPMGTGEEHFGSIGYWLKPEFSTAVSHEPGTLGAWHGEEVESAACKFYINLGRATWRDGNFTLFGKVTQGLDVVRDIHKAPVMSEALQERPLQPVIMRSVTVTATIQD